MQLKYFVLFCLFYSVIIWPSHFSLFLFVPLLVFFVLNSWQDKFKVKPLLFTLFFLASFLPFYFLYLKFISSNAALHEYWANYFITSFANVLPLIKLFFASTIPFFNYFVLIFALLLSIIFLENNNRKVFLILFLVSPFLASF